MNISESFVTSDDLKLQRTNALFLQAPFTNIAIVLVAILMFFLLRHYSDSLMHLTWPGLMLLFSLMRLGIWHQRNLHPDKYRPEQWFTRYALTTAIMGLAWGSVFFLPFINTDLILYGALLMLMFAVTASAVLVLSVSLPVFVSYTLPMMVCFSLAAYYREPTASFYFIAASLIYYGMLFSMARTFNQRLMASLKLESENQLLIKKLEKEAKERESLIEERTRALKDSENRLRNVISGAELGYWDWYYQTGVHEVNDRWLEMLGLTRSDIKNSVDDWAERIHPDDKERMTKIVQNAIKTQTPYVADFRMKHKNGEWTWIQGAGALIESDPVSGMPIRLCGTHQDITVRKALEQELEFRARHDSLTGLYNRSEMEKYFMKELERSSRYNRDLSMFLIDIDHFKKINDQHGHQTGDEILKQFATFLQGAVRTSDFVARYGGEEFIVILPETTQQKAHELAERIRIKTTKLYLEMEQIHHKITISLGIASFPMHGENYDELVSIADKAMYEAKQNGRNQVCLASL